MRKKVGFTLQPGLKGYFLSSNRIFHFSVPAQSYFFAIVRNTKSFPTINPGSCWSYRSFELPPLQLRIGCAFRVLSKQGRYVVCVSAETAEIHFRPLCISCPWCDWVIFLGHETSGATRP